MYSLAILKKYVLKENQFSRDHSNNNYTLNNVFGLEHFISCYIIIYSITYLSQIYKQYPCSFLSLIIILY